MKSKVLVLALAAGLAVSGALFAGGSKEKEHTIVLGYAPPTMNNPFWAAVLEGITTVTTPANIKVITIDPQNDQSRMNDLISDLIVQGIDVLLVAPFDSAGIRPALEACKQKGTPVINFDTPVADKELVRSIIASDNINAGAVVARDMKSKLPEGSEVAIIHSPSGQACIDRYDGFLAESAGYFTIVQPIPDGKGDTGVTLPIAEDMLQGHPALAAFFAVNDPSAAGCVQAIAAHPDRKGILVYGVDGNPDEKQMIAEGSMTGTGAQSPISIGKKTAETAIDLLQGKPVAANIVIPTFIINSDNISKYNNNGWQ